MITVVTLCRNEIYLVPFFLRHYGQMVDRIVVFDNASTDGSSEALGAHKKVSVVPYDSGGKLDDGINLSIKNSAYKNMPGDWFVIVDFDEFIWHRDLRRYLDWCLNNGITLPLVDGWNMIGDVAPADGLLTDKIKLGVKDDHYCKRSVIHRSVDIRYEVGCHACSPWGCVASESAEIKLLHYNWISKEYGLEKRRRTAAAISKNNIDNLWGMQCFKLDEEARYFDDAKNRRTLAFE